MRRRSSGSVRPTGRWLSRCTAQLYFSFQLERVEDCKSSARVFPAFGARIVWHWVGCAFGVRRSLAVLAGVVLFLLPGLAAADDEMAEVWSGVQVTQNSWYAYSGIIYAFGGDIFADGWRLRATGGGGTYSYAGRLPLQSPDTADIDFTGSSAASDIAIGYQQRFGPVIAKAFVGASYDDHRISPGDVFNPVSGSAFGAIGAVDLWADLDDKTWASLGGSFDTAFSSYAVYASAGYRLLPELSAGIEAGAFGNESLDAGRLGALLKWDTAYGELTAAAGVSGDYEDPSTPYGRVSWLVRF